eukprot:1270124-Rhodomonas_salina.3
MHETENTVAVAHPDHGRRCPFGGGVALDGAEARGGADGPRPHPAPHLQPPSHLLHAHPGPCLCSRRWGWRVSCRRWCACWGCTCCSSCSCSSSRLGHSHAWGCVGGSLPPLVSRWLLPTAAGVRSPLASTHVRSRRAAAAVGTGALVCLVTATTPPCPVCCRISANDTPADPPIPRVDSRGGAAS